MRAGIFFAAFALPFVDISISITPSLPNIGRGRSSKPGLGSTKNNEQVKTAGR